MYVGNRQASQYMMRGRVFFQGVTIACLVYSGYPITIYNYIYLIYFNIVS